MPFSRSRSPESMTRSVSSWWAPKAPVWRSSASTSVVLPWSTWATMATFLMSSRWLMGEPTIGEVWFFSGGGADRPAAARQHQRHRLGPQREQRRLGLDPHEAA